MKYRKRPVVIDAAQWTGANGADVLDLTDFAAVFGGTRECPTVTIETLEGTMTANIGDWIIRGVAGECYPCKPDIFERTYEPVADPEPRHD